MQKETVVISKEELRQSIGIKGFLGKWIAGFVYWLLELKRVNYIQNKHADKMGPDFSDAVLRFRDDFLFFHAHSAPSQHFLKF